VVDDPEVHDRVDRAGCLLDRTHVAHRQRHRTTVQPSSGQLDHRVVEVKRHHSLGTEAVEDHLGSDAAAAADFKHVLAGQIAARQPPEPRGLPPVLMCGP
jgi:hypothetical protein